MVASICSAAAAVPIVGIIIQKMGFGEPDPCVTASLVANSTSINDIVYRLGSEKIEQQFEPMKLDFSSESGICGA